MKLNSLCSPSGMQSNFHAEVNQKSVHNYNFGFVASRSSGFGNKFASPISKMLDGPPTNHTPMTTN